MKKKLDPAEALGLTEHQIEASILERLGLIREGYPCKIVNNGAIKKTASGKIILVPQNNPYFRKGFSDVVFFHPKKTFFFEVKTWKDWDQITRRRDFFRDGIHTDKTYIRWQNQILFQDEMRRIGHIAEFVHSIAQVEFQVRRFVDL